MLHEERPFSYAILTTLQLIALGLSALIVMNMLIDSAKAPVPVCPIQQAPETP